MKKRLVFVSWLLTVALIASGCYVRMEEAMFEDMDSVEDASGDPSFDTTGQTDGGGQSDSTIGSCTSNEQCSSGVCYDGRCVQCVNSGQCAEGYYCQGNICILDTSDECEHNIDCADDRICIDGECIVPPDCHNDSDCDLGTFCAQGVCVSDEDEHGRTSRGASGADVGGPDQTPDQRDDDGDCFCDLSAEQISHGMSCLESVNPDCERLLPGDCDDTVTGIENNPVAHDGPDPAGPYDNDCDGEIDEDGPWSRLFLPAAPFLYRFQYRYPNPASSTPFLRQVLQNQVA